MTRVLAVLAIIAMGLMLVFGASGLPALFDPDSPASTNVSPRYIERSWEETGLANYVTAVLADYRAFDTLGEAAVIFTAGIAAALIARPYVKGKKKEHKNHIWKWKKKRYNIDEK